MKDKDWDKIFLEKAGSEYSDNSLEYLGKIDPQFLYDYIINSDQSENLKGYAIPFLTLGEIDKILDLIINLAKNNQIEFFRAQGIDSLYALYMENLISKEKVKDIYKDLLKTEESELPIQLINEFMQEFEYDL